MYKLLRMTRLYTDPNRMRRAYNGPEHPFYSIHVQVEEEGYLPFVRKLNAIHRACYDMPGEFQLPDWMEGDMEIPALRQNLNKSPKPFRELCRHRNKSIENVYYAINTERDLAIFLQTIRCEAEVMEKLKEIILTDHTPNYYI